MKAVVNLVFYKDVLFQSFIQISDIVLCSSSQPDDELCSEVHPTTSTQFFHLSLQKILGLHIESLSTYFSKPAQLNDQAWTFCIANVIPCLKVHNTHRLNLWMFTPVTYTVHQWGGWVFEDVWNYCMDFFLGLSFQKSTYRFHVPVHIRKQAAVRTSETNSEGDVSTDVAQLLDYSFSMCLGCYGITGVNISW